MSLWNWLVSWLRGPQPVLPQWQPSWTEFLRDHVDFYNLLSAEEQAQFELRVRYFLATTAVEGSEDVEVTDADCLLVAASAIIPVWAFPDWHYFNIRAVFLLPAAFNQQFQCGQPDSHITGMVGTGPMSGKLALSKPDLHAGFANHQDKHNVGIHEFAHLVDLADGTMDGFPERLEPYRFSTPWFSLVQQKVHEIETRRTGISRYGTTNNAEFFAVASEYFFERPDLMEQKHPQLYRWLSEFYQQNRAPQYRALRKAAAQQRAQKRAKGSGRHG